MLIESKTFNDGILLKSLMTVLKTEGEDIRSGINKCISEMDYTWKLYTKYILSKTAKLH